MYSNEKFHKKTPKTYTQGRGIALIADLNTEPKDSESKSYPTSKDQFTVKRNKLPLHILGGPSEINNSL